MHARECNTHGRRPIRCWLLFGAAAFASVGLIGCGGGSKQDVDRILAQTFTGGHSIRSGRLSLRLVVDAKGIAGQRGPVTIAVTGPFASRGAQPPAFDLDLRLGSNGATLTGGVVSTGGRGFVELQGSSYAVPDPIFAGFREGFERVRARGSPAASLGSLGIDPRRWMKDPRNEGEDDVAGAPTVHVSSDIDVPRLLADVVKVFQKASQLGLAEDRRLATMLTDRQRKAVAEAIEDESFDVFAGRRDHILRRLRVAFGFTVPKEQQQRANGLKSGKVSFDLELAGVNEPQLVRAPARAKPFAELRSALGSIGTLGPLLWLERRTKATGGATPDQPAASSPAASAQAYAQCVSAAAGDLAKAQRCSTLIPGR